MINWFFFGFCDLCFYKLLIFVKLIFVYVIFSLDILKKKKFFWVGYYISLFCFILNFKEKWNMYDINW